MSTTVLRRYRSDARPFDLLDRVLPLPSSSPIYIPFTTRPFNYSPPILSLIFYAISSGKKRVGGGGGVEQGALNLMLSRFHRDEFLTVKLRFRTRLVREAYKNGF